MPLIQPTAGDILRDHFPHRVYGKSAWTDDWVEIPHCYADRVFKACSPEMSSAELVWKFGEGMPAGTVRMAEWGARDLLDHYVLIEIDQGEDESGEAIDPITWIGYVTEQGENRKGALQSRTGGDLILTGDQVFLAVGMEHFLDQTVIEESWVWDAAEEKKVLIRRGLPFNFEHGFARAADQWERGRRGNRTPEKGPDGVYLFTNDLTTAEVWTTLDIIEYLIQYHSPRRIDDQLTIPWDLSYRSRDILPDWDEPVIQTHGRSFKSILDQLLDRRRLFGWQVYVATMKVQEECFIDVFTFNGDVIDLPSGGTQWNNEDTVELDFDQAVDIERAVLRDSTAHQVEQVRVVGARKRAILTFSGSYGTLVEDWNDAEQTSYAVGPDGISSEDPDVQEQRVKDFRGQDNLQRVYSWFRLPADWDGYVYDATGASEEPQEFFPPDETVPENDPRRHETLYMPELRFCPKLHPSFLAKVSPTGSPDEGAPPIVLLKVEISEERARYQHVDQLGTTASVETEGLGFSCSVQIQREAPGLILKVNGSQGQHAIAKNTFTPGKDTDELGVIDYTTLIATVMMELDSRVEAVYPPTSEVEGQQLDVARVLTLDIGERGRMDFCSPYTIGSIVDGVPVWSHWRNSFLRDDRQKMTDLARLAYDWYSVPRQAFSFAFRQLSSLLAVGQLITKIGQGDTEEEVNSVVTSVLWDLVHGGTHVTTAYAEIDVVAM